MENQSILAGAAEARKARMIHELEQFGLSWDKMAVSARLALLTSGTRITPLPTAAIPVSDHPPQGLNHAPG